MAAKSDLETVEALSDLNKAYQAAVDAPSENLVGWDDHEAFREAMRRPVKTTDAAGAALIAKALGDAIRVGSTN
ncbi:hypothetical protein [Bosea robiniae]|uniref:Uncharacterized protein n=1 Tax=Bosea robiniae TaxID=1036780 RepID=A0ABY0NF20_9HYPH|nr:hypothetical protein [Bosea robiniae]SDF36569.1 hypothetical protein SAMN05421844_101438 [Bosea robiniae]